jgi:hypothetical protein
LTIAPPACAAHVVVRPELADLEDHLEMRFPGRFFHLDDLVVDLGVAAREKRPAVDHHVDLVRAHLDDVAHLSDLDVRRRLARRERRRDRRDLDARALDLLDRSRDEIRVDAERGHRGNPRIRRIRSDGLRRQRGDLPRRVLALQRGQVHHPHGQIEGEELCLALDRAAGQRSRALLDCDLVDGADSGDPRLER